MHGLCIAFMVAVIVVLAQPAAGQGAGTETATPADTTRAVGDGYGVSYWGVIPTPSDSVTVAYADPPTPAWESAVNFPYYVIRIPFAALFGAAGAVVKWSDRSGVATRLGLLFGQQRLPYGFGLSFTGGDLTGFGIGLTFEHRAVFSPYNRLRITIKGSETDHRRITGGFTLGNTRKNQWDFGAGIREEPNARYYGIGPNSLEENISFYLQRMSWAGVSYQRQIVDKLFLQPMLLYSEVLADESPENSPQIFERFPDQIPTGYGKNSIGWVGMIGLTHDQTTRSGRPERGGYRRFNAAYFTNREEDLNYWSYRLELQQFIPLWFTERALALRFFYSDIDIGTDSLPFQRMMVNDDPDIIRGYRDFRFRDRGMTSLTAEYRWPLWAAATIDGTGLDAYVFGDLGQVFQDPEQIKRDNLSAAVGLGLRLISLGRFVGRFEWGWSEEGNIFRLRTDQLFQFEKGTLYYGRKPIPSR